ncbi:hypothetical protein GP486_006211 [Trichoglossum hirsutum]|uniref:Major facilitator superfamily (MFS) profile domain-containing protein n=1 Tax=Trichoglossum hirsutum TaxID=265104 RepID=A0A9P8L7U9_9PEZI|nr:hypothetical protein GP486_006211 [Trichoglossum hirsutum]
MSFAVFCNLFGAGILTLFVPLLTKGLGHAKTANPTGQSRTLALFAGLNALAFILIFFLVPETAGAMLGTEQGSLNYISLEELNYIFGVKTREHMKYQVETVVPWAWHYYVLRRPEDRQNNSPELLYTWVRSRTETQQQQSQQQQSQQQQSQQQEKMEQQPESV